jgi:UDP-2,3-diacylglucosamine pyrophosphatase LpxH
MNKHFSILHISDLHKGENNDFAHLFASLCNDADSYDQNIPKPEIIVVSGDLAEGANGEDAGKKIQRQYEEVEVFLNQLVVHFLNGDKSRIIIVPGNHDLFRGATIKSMALIPDEIRETAKDRYFKGDPNYRWNWEDFHFYFINNENEYASRFRFFVEFYNRFFKDIRSIDNCDMLNSVIDLPEYNIAFATFNSCYRIDHLNQVGAINTNAIAASQANLSKAFKYGRFIVGVWHHNISGVPTQVNYLDSKVLHGLMDFHIQLGLYGHQHHAEALYEYHDIFKQGRMTLISSGCLYGRGKAMPEGTHCQYNILEIEQNEKKVYVTLHVREDETAWDIPSWRKKQIDGKDSYRMEFDLPIIDYKRLLSDFVNQAKSKGEYKKAVENLISIRDKESSADKFIDEFIKELSNEDICEIKFIPKTTTQIITVLGACIETRAWNTFDKTIANVNMEGIKNLQIEVLIEEAKKIR